MRRASKRRKVVTVEVDTVRKKPCCICCKLYIRANLLELSTVIDNIEGASSRTIAEIIEQVATVKLKQIQQTICNTCWGDVNTAYIIQNKIRQSKHLQMFYENEVENQPNQTQDDQSNYDAKTTNTANDSDAKLEIVTHYYDDEYECEYLDEYLEPSKPIDHTYDNRCPEEEEANSEEVPFSLSLLPDVEQHVVKEEPLSSSDHHITRQFVMPREMFVQRDEVTDLCRLLEVTGERCCGCSFIAENRRELLQHSETVHAVEITDIGDYCPICFFKFATDEQLERHIQEFKSTTVFVCMQCNRFYNSRQKFCNHLLRCTESNGEVSQDETECEEDENGDTIDADDYDEIIEETFPGVEYDSKVTSNDSLTAAYQRKMSLYAARFDEIVANEIFSCELDEPDLNIQTSQIVDQHNFDTFRYVRLRGERCCGCSFICPSRDQLIQHAKSNHANASSDQDDLTCSLCCSHFNDEKDMLKHLCFFTSKELFFCTICSEAFLNKEGLKRHQQQNERHRERQTEKLQQEGIEMIGPVMFVELNQPEVIEQLAKMQAEKAAYRPKMSRYVPMPDSRFIKEIVEHKNYCVLSVVGLRCCGCGKYFDTRTDLKQHSIQEHALPLGSGWVSDHLQCDICYAVFDFERGLTLHRSLRRGNQASLYLCKLCGLLFTKKFCLARHMQSAPNHLSKLIVNASTNKRQAEVDGEQRELPEGEVNDPPEADPCVSEALGLHKSIKETGLKKAGHFVGYHCCFAKCTLKFHYEEQLLEHSHMDHKGQRRENESERKSEENICPCCCKAFHDRAKLTWHRFQRFVPRQYNCKHCDESFDKWLKLKLHVEKEHSASPPKFVCIVCNKSFILNSRLKVHMKLHTKKREFSCDVCGDKFNSNGLMKRHRRSVHSTELLFECKLCPKRFAVIEKLQIHQRVHTGERPFECSYCSRTFSHYTDRKRHEMAAHTGERPHKCPYCPAAYVRNRELSLHMQKHKNQTL